MERLDLSIKQVELCFAAKLLRVLVEIDFALKHVVFLMLSSFIQTNYSSTQYLIISTVQCAWIERLVGVVRIVEDLQVINGKLKLIIVTFGSEIDDCLAHLCREDWVCIIVWVDKEGFKVC